MFRTVSYTLHDTRTTWDFNRCLGPDSSQVLNYQDGELTRQLERRFTERVIARFYQIPVEKLRSQFFEYEEYMLPMVIKFVRNFRFGRLTEQQYFDCLNDFLADYQKLFMNEGYHYSQQLEIESTERAFQEKLEKRDQETS